MNFELFVPGASHFGLTFRTGTRVGRGWDALKREIDDSADRRKGVVTATTALRAGRHFFG